MYRGHAVCREIGKDTFQPGHEILCGEFALAQVDHGMRRRFAQEPGGLPRFGVAVDASERGIGGVMIEADFL